LSEFGELLPTLYQLDRANGWSVGMRALTHALLNRATLPPGPILELGCGAGVFNGELQERYPERWVGGVDLHPLALAYARASGPQPPHLLRADLQRLPVASAAVSGILALDVFDQQGVDVCAALAESWRLLRPGGLILLRVSAHPWLEGAHDRAFNTGRRFRRSELEEALKEAGFVVTRMTYANVLLSPPLVAVRLLQRWGWLQIEEDGLVDSPLNRLFANVLRIEADWLADHNLVFGISLYAVATKPMGDR
jgi:ubiquinone/menaquinone biosynthesis C-methylase UbiE